MAPGATAVRPNLLGSALMSEGVAGLRRVLTEEPALLGDRQAKEDLADTFLLLEVGLGTQGDRNLRQMLRSLQEELLDLPDVGPDFIGSMLKTLEGIPVATATERVLGLTRFADSAQTSAAVGAVLRARSGAEEDPMEMELYAFLREHGLLIDPRAVNVLRRVVKEIETFTTQQSKKALSFLVWGFVTGKMREAGEVLQGIVNDPALDDLFDGKVIQSMWSALQELNREIDASIPEARPHSFEAKIERASALRETLGILIRRSLLDNPRIPNELRRAYLYSRNDD